MFHVEHFIYSSAIHEISDLQSACNAVRNPDGCNIRSDSSFYRWKYRKNYCWMPFTSRQRLSVGFCADTGIIPLCQQIGAVNGWFQLVWRVNYLRHIKKLNFPFLSKKVLQSNCYSCSAVRCVGVMALSDTLPELLLYPSTNNTHDSHIPALSAL